MFNYPGVILNFPSAKVVVRRCLWIRLINVHAILQNKTCVAIAIRIISILRLIQMKANKVRTPFRHGEASIFRFPQMDDTETRVVFSRRASPSIAFVVPTGNEFVAPWLVPENRWKSINYGLSDFQKNEPTVYMYNRLRSSLSRPCRRRPSDAFVPGRRTGRH